MDEGVHQCLVYSLAMLLDESPDALIQELGHDGMREVFPDYPVPHNYQGHHIQEIIELCLNRGIALTPVEFMPRYASAKDPTDWRCLYLPDDASKRFKRLITGRKGILIGRNYKGNGHACAWDGHIVWDPNGYHYHLSNFQVSECWIFAITSE